MTEYRFGDICKVINGRAYRQPELLDAGKYPVLRVGNFFSSDRWFYSDLELPEDKYCDNGDLLFAWSASFGPRIWDGGKVIYHYHIWKLEPNEAIVDKYYLYYWLRKSVDILTAGTHGSVMAHMTKGDMENQRIFLPCIEEQRKVGKTLRLLHDKIKINSKINDNLQQQAYAYFLRLFVENADPSWRVGTIADLGTVVGGGTPSKAKQEYYTEDGIAWITPKDLSIDKSKFIAHGENDISELGYQSSSATMMPAGTVLFSSRAPIGYIAIASNEVTTNQGFKSVVPHPEIGTPFVYYFLIHNLPLIESKASGSTFKEVSGSVMKSVEAVIPDGDALAKFDDFCRPVFEMQRKLEQENRKLAAMRDSLLPRLMSGEIDVADVEV